MGSADQGLWDLVKWGATGAIGFIAWWVKGVSAKVDRVSEDLSAYKEKVAQTYVAADRLQEVKRELMDHLVRIERKIDNIGHHGGGE